MRATTTPTPATTATATTAGPARSRGFRAAGRWRGRRLLAGLVVAGVALAGCGGDDADEAGTGDDVTHAAEGAEGGLAFGDEDGEGRPVEAAGPAGLGDEAAVPIAQVAAGPTAGRSVIRNARVSVEADDTVALVASVRQRVVALGGYVGAEELRGTERGLVGTMTLRVPTAELDTALDEIDGLADTVVSRSLDSQDVTEQLTDLDARLRNLRALEVELAALLTETRERTSDPQQVLAIFDRVNGTRQEIERLDAQQAGLRQRVGLATIVLDVAPTPLPPGAAPEGDPTAAWSPATTLAAAGDALAAVARVVVDAAIWLAVVAVPVLAAVALAWLLLRRLAGAVPARRPAPAGGEA